MKSFKFVTLCFAVLSFSLLSSKANVIKSPAEDARLNRWLEYIQEQEGNLEMGPENEAVIIMGNDRSGKTTLSLLLTDGDMDGIQEPNGSFHFTDQNNCIATGIDRKQRIPMLLVDESSDTTYYDWTGFEFATGPDAELVEHDILASHFLKIFAKSMKAVKFVFTVSESILDPTEQMETFLEFVHRITDLIKNIDKYRDAIAVVVTKVRGQFQCKKTDSYDWHTEKLHIEEIGTRLESAKRELELRLQHHDDRHDEKHGYTLVDLERMKQLVDILLEKKDGRYQRIGILREPQEDIPVKYMTVQQHEKLAIRKIINDYLHFVATHVDDFGYAVSKQTEKKQGYDKLKAHLEQ